MDKELRVLIVEDSIDDAEITARELSNGGLAHIWKLVKSKGAFLKALEEFAPDIILCDYRMPGFSVPEALEIIKNSFPEIPFIVVSGAISEDAAVDIMKLGVNDYIMKDRLGRLVPAVQHALEWARNVAERRKADQLIKDMAYRFQAVVESVGEGITFSDAAGRFLVYNLRMQELTGFTVDEANNSGDFTRLLYPDPLDRKKAFQRLQEIVEHKVALPLEVEATIQVKDGTKKLFWISTVMVRFKGQEMFLSIYRDITERKKAEEMLNRVNKCFLAFGRNSDENIRKIVETTGLILDGVCALYNKEEGIFLSTIEGWNVPGGFKRKNSKEGRLCHDVIAKYKDEPFVVNELDKTPYAKSDSNVAKYNLKTYIGCAVKVKDEVVGSLCVVYQNNRAFVSNELNIFSVLVKALGIEEERKRAEEELKKIDQLKSDFISIVSHELRTPLSITKEGISLVLDKVTGEINEKQEKMLSIAKSNIDRLARIIDSLLDISKIEAGKVELKRELVDIAGLVRQLALSFGLDLKKKNLELKVNVPQKQIDVFVEPDKLAQVIINLIGNALKFTNEGYIEISLQEKEKEVECVVADTGLGINKEDLPKIFNKFQQFGRLAGPGEKGTGLGLAITKGIIELHGGKIWVQSPAWPSLPAGRQGAKFSFILPKYTTEEIFKEYLNNGIKEAMDKKSRMALIVICILEFNKLKQEFSDEKMGVVLRNIEGIIRDILRHKSDIVFKASGEMMAILIDCDKEAALSIKNRLKEASDKYLISEKLSGEIKLRFGCAVYPDEAKNDTELIEKAQKA